MAPMSTKAELIALAARCEDATGPDRELFEAVYAAINGASVGEIIYRHGVFGTDPDFDKGAAARHFAELIGVCAWLDAAMSLAEGKGGELVFFKDGIAKAFLWQPYPLAVEALAATPALALTAASLRALAARMKEQG